MLYREWFAARYSLKKAGLQRSVLKNPPAGAGWRTAGVDGMSVKELPAHLKLHRDAIANAIRSGSYISQPILGVAIPKDDGTQRLLGVPSVVDRLLQQAAHQVISLKFEPEFKECSYGFRPGRSCGQPMCVRFSWGVISQGLTALIVSYKKHPCH